MGNCFSFTPCREILCATRWVQGWMGCSSRSDTRRICFFAGGGEFSQVRSDSEFHARCEFLAPGTRAARGIRRLWGMSIQSAPCSSPQTISSIYAIYMNHYICYSSTCELRSKMRHHFALLDSCPLFAFQ